MVLIAVLAFVSALVMGIIVVGKVAPEWFLKMNGGFILWAMTGNPMPPYFSPEAWLGDESDSWTKEGDVIVSTGPKSGTNWMLYLVHQIRTRGNDEKFPFVDANLSTIWPDLIQTPGDSWSDQKPRYSTVTLPEYDDKPLKDLWDHPKYPFRIFKSHFSPLETGGVIPIKKLAERNVKVLAMSRNGLDVVASIIPFFANHSEEFRKMWGGFPEKSSGDLSKDAETNMKNMLPGGLLGHLYFKYVKEWWSLKDEPNVLLLHYADVKKDLSSNVTKVAKFVGVQLTSEEHAKVVKKCSFAYMKERASEFDYLLPLNTNTYCTIMKTGTLINKGTNGAGKVTFTEKQQATWKEAEEKEFGGQPGLLEWARNGEGNGNSE